MYGKGPFAARKGGELRSQFFRVPERWREGMLRGVAPVNGRVRSPRRRSGLQTGPSERPGQGQVEVFPALSHLKRTTPKERNHSTTFLLSFAISRRTVSLQRSAQDDSLSSSLSRRLTFQLTLKTTHFPAHQTTLNDWCHNLQISLSGEGPWCSRHHCSP